MLLLTDVFRFSAINAGVGKEFPITVTPVSKETLKEKVAELVSIHGGHQSLLLTKKAAALFTKELDQEVDVFKSRFFTIQDMLKVNENNVILYCEYDKEHDEHNWYLITIRLG